ncbi:2OG-Fe(II) oxygenase [Paenibacillus sp. FSL H7-0940]|uniref:2OG-Fe(II) oxygenase n=1 Tax=Paenibacillus sp. FSL H7-0940 TaxID=2921443 RepID=UPI0030EB40FF
MGEKRVDLYENPVISQKFVTLEQPYFHFKVEQFFDSKVAGHLLSWLQDTNLYRTVEGGFYKQTMFPITTDRLPEDLQNLFDEKNRNQIQKKAEQYFETMFHDSFLITAHRLLPTEKTLIHNDYLADPYHMKYGFTHRIIVYINDQWKREDGGVLGVYASDQSSDLVHTYEPIHNSAIGLAFSPNSYHDVSEVVGGERYTINFTFLSKSPNFKK